MLGKLRLTRSIVLVVILFIIFYLYASDTIPSDLGDRLRSFEYTHLTPEINDFPAANTAATKAQNIHGFWRHWSQVFHDHRPQTEPINLSGNAELVAIAVDDHDARGPPQNRVLNSESEIESLRASHAALLETIQSENVAGDMFNGVGVVTVGGGEYFGPAVIGLHMLRKTGSTLPVEVFVADMSEFEPRICDLYLPRFGARCVVLTDFWGNQNALESFKVTHYQLKSLAMLFSSFAEVLYLDSDSIPLVEPSAGLFSSEPYKSTGLVLWPDFWIATESPLFYTIAGLPDFPSNLPKSSSEAGQILINKKTHLKTLLLANYYNIYGPDYYYPLLSQGVLGQGDKETFMAAALVTGEPYFRVESPVVSVGRHDGRAYKGSGMVQYHPSKKALHTETTSDSTSDESNSPIQPAFIHANTPKMNAGHLVDEGDLFDLDNQRLRLWGSKEDQEKLFGYDLEKVVWELLVESGCELEGVSAEWMFRGRMCARLKEHLESVFG